MTDPKNGQKKKAPPATLEEIKAIYQMPDVVPADLCEIVKMLEDKDGNTWVFFDATNEYFVNAYAVRMKVEGQKIKMLLRAEAAGVSSPPMEEGDFPVVSRNQWLEEQDQTWPEDLLGKGQDAVRLPFRPESIEIVNYLD